MFRTGVLLKSAVITDTFYLFAEDKVYCTSTGDILAIDPTKLQPVLALAVGHIFLDFEFPAIGKIHARIKTFNDRTICLESLDQTKGYTCSWKEFTRTTLLKQKKENKTPTMDELKIYRNRGGSYYFELGSQVYNIYKEVAFAAEDNGFTSYHQVLYVQKDKRLPLAGGILKVLDLKVGSLKVEDSTGYCFDLPWQQIIAILKNPADEIPKLPNKEESMLESCKPNIQINLPAIVGRFPEKFKILLETKKTALSEKTLVLNANIIGEALGGIVTKKDSNKDDLVLTIGSVTEPLYAANLCEFVEKTINEVENLSKLNETHYRLIRLMHELDAIVSIKFTTPERKPLLLVK